MSNLRIGSFVMIKTTRRLSILSLAATLLLGVLSQGCALAPKPSELEALEKLRASPSAAEALKLKNAAALVKSSDELLRRSQAKWKSSDLDESTDAALMGQAKLKHAIALADQDSAKRRIAKAEDDLDDVAEEQEKVQKELDAVNETIGLLHQTAQAKDEQKALAAQMEADRKTATDKAETSDKISAAELALKTADTVQASTYAKAEYTAAADTLARAQAELQQGNFRGAQMSADIARKKAEEAVATAQPIYADKTKADDNRARADTLTREASTIAGVEVRRDARGALQRIVLTIPAEQIFTKKQSVIAPGRDAMLDPVATLMKKKEYLNYPVQIVGFADPRGSSSSLLALTLARAQSVATALMSRGVDSKRVMATGQGGAEQVASGKDRSRNNRIEIIFLYQ
ncbi:MAG TPA: OmpA family protein [Polyangia bacterium]|nr:OmpA family protein [Polyangia bacterium]